MNTRRRRRPLKPRPDLLRRRAAPRAPANTAPFYGMLPPKPTSNNRDDAHKYHAAICELLDYDAKYKDSAGRLFKRSDRANLQRLERRWARRAAGQDARWNLVGAKSGRAFRELESQYRNPADPSWE